MTRIGRLALESAMRELGSDQETEALRSLRAFLWRGDEWARVPEDDYGSRARAECAGEIENPYPLEVA